MSATPTRATIKVYACSKKATFISQRNSFEPKLKAMIICGNSTESVGNNKDTRLKKTC